MERLIEASFVTYAQQLLPDRAGGGGATLGFGYLADLNDVARYAGTSYSFLGLDELARFSEPQYRRMFRVLRQPSQSERSRLAAARDGTTLADVPVRVRSTSTPGGPGHGWVKSRFVDPATRHQGTIFLPARLADNPFLDRDAYLRSLAQLPASERNGCCAAIGRSPTRASCSSATGSR